MQGQQAPVLVHVQAAVGAAQRGDAAVVLQVGRQTRITDREVLVRRRRGQHTFAHQLLQRRVLDLRRIQQVQVHAGVAGAQAIHVLTMRVVPFGLRDGLAVDRGHLGGGIAHARVPINAKEHK